MATNIGSAKNIKCICCLNNSLKLYEPRNRRWVINKISEKLERLCGEDIIQTVENVIGIGLCQRCMKKFCYSWETLSMVQNNIARIAVNSSQDNNQPFIAASEQIQNVNHIRCLPPINLPEPDYTLVLDHAYNRKSDNLGDVKNRIGSIGDISQVPLLSGCERKEHSLKSKSDKRKVTQYYDDSDNTNSDSEMSDNISDAESSYPEEEVSIQKQHADNSIEHRSQNGEIKSRKSSDLDHYIDDNQSEEEESTERQGIWDDDSSDNKVPTGKQQSLSCTSDHNYNASPINEELKPRSSHDKEVQLPSTLTHLKRKASSQTVPVENNLTMSFQSGKCANQADVSSKKIKVTDSNKIEPNFHVNSTPATKLPGPSSKSTMSSGTKPQKINLRFDVKRTKKASNQQSGSKPVLPGSASLASIRISLSSKAVGMAESHAGSDTKATNFILFQDGKAILQEEKNSEGNDPATGASSEKVHLDGPDDFCSVQVVAPNTGVLTGCKVRLAGIKPVKIPKGVPNFRPESLQQNGTHLASQQLGKHVSIQQVKPNPAEPTASDEDTVGKSVEHVEQNVEQLFEQSSCAQMINPYTLIPIADLQEKIDRVADCEPSLQEKVDRMTGCEPSLQENVDRITSCSPLRNKDCEERVSADAMSGTQKEVAAVKKYEQLTREDCELQVEQSANIPFKIENFYHLKNSEHCVQNANITTYSEQQEKDKVCIKLQRENNNDPFVCSQQCDQNEKELLSKMHPRQKDEGLICTEQYEQFAHGLFASNEQQVQDENFAANIPQLEQNIRPNERRSFVCLEQLKQTTGGFFASIPLSAPDNPDIDVSSEQSSVNGSMQQLRHKDTFIVFPRKPFSHSEQFMQNDSYNVSEDPFGQSEQFTQNDSCNVSGDPLQQNEQFIQNGSCAVIEDPFGQSEQFMQNNSCNVSGDPLEQNEQFVQNDSCNTSENPFAQSAQFMHNDSFVAGEQSDACIVISGEEFWQNDACIVVSGEPFGHNNNDYFTCKDQLWQNENAASEGKESSSHLSNSLPTNLQHSSVVVQSIDQFAQIFDSVAGSEQSVYEAVQVEPSMLNNGGFDFTTYPVNM